MCTIDAVIVTDSDNGFRCRVHEHNRDEDTVHTDDDDGGDGADDDGGGGAP